MQKESEKNDLPKAVIKLTRSLRKRIESADSDASERSNTPIVFDLEKKNETASLNEEVGELDVAATSQIRKSTRARSELKSAEVMNSPVRRRGRRASSVTLEENINIQEENTKTPIKQAAPAIVGRRTTRRSSILLGDTIELSPGIAIGSPSRRGRRRSINLSEDGTESKANNPPRLRKMTLLDTCVPEEGDANQVQYLENSSRSDNSKSPNNELTEAYEQDKLCPALCTRSRSKSPRELISQQNVSTDGKNNEKTENEKNDVETENDRDKNVDNCKELTNIGDSIGNITENSSNKSTTETSQNKCQENNSDNLNYEFNVNDIKDEPLDEEDVIQMRVDENDDDDNEKDNLKANLINDQENEKNNDDNENNVENSIEVGKSNSKKLSLNMNESKMNYSQEETRKIVDEEMEELEDLDKSTSKDVNDDIENSRNINTTASISKNIANDNSINIESNNLINFSQKEIDKDVTMTDLTETDEKNNSISNNDTPSKKCTELNDSKNKKSILDKSKNLEDDNGKKDKENLSMNTITISNNLISKYGAENALTPFKKRMSTELTASSTPIIAAEKSINENNTAKLMDENKDNEDESRANYSVQDGSPKKRNSSKKHQSVVIKPTEINDKSSKFPKTPIPSKSRSHISGFNFDEANNDNLMETSSDSISNSKSDKSEKNSSRNDMSCVRGTLNLSDNENTSLKTLPGDKSIEKKILKSSFATSWEQSVKGTADVTIDAYGLKKNDTIEKKEERQDGKESFTVMNKSRNFSNVKDTDDEIENEDEAEEEKNEFIDDEAEEVEDYKSNDSMDSEEREYLKNNEIPDDGVSIGSKDTIENYDDRNDDGSGQEYDDEMDSFIESDTEEQQRLSGELSTDEYEFKSDTSDIDKNMKEKFNKNKRKIISSDDESNDNIKEENKVEEEDIEKSSENMDTSKKITKLQISDEGEDFKQKSDNNNSKSLIEVNQLEENIPKTTNDDKNEEKETNDKKVDELNESEDSEKTEVTTESENNLSKESMELQETNEKNRSRSKNSSDSDSDTCELDHDKKSVSITCGTNMKDLIEYKDKTSLKKSERHSLPLKILKHIKTYRDSKSMEKEITSDMEKKPKDLFVLDVKKADAEIKASSQQSKNTIEKNFRDNDALNKSTNALLSKNDSQNTSENESESSTEFFKNFLNYSYDKNDSNDSSDSEKNHKNDLESDENKEEMNQSSISRESTKQSPSSNLSKNLIETKKPTFEKVTTETNNEKKNTTNNKSLEKEHNVITMSDEERIMKKCNEMLEAELEAKKKDKLLNKKPKDKKKNKDKKKKNKSNQNDDSIDNIVEKEKEYQTESSTTCHDKEVEKALKFSVKLMKEEIEKCKTHPKGLKSQKSLVSKRLPKNEIIDAIEESQKEDDVDDEVIQKSTKKHADTTKHLKRKFFDEWSSPSSSVEAEHSEKPKNIEKKRKKLTGIIRNSSGIFFEESITPKKSKNNNAKLLKFSWGIVREEDITSDSKITKSGFKETAVTPIKSGKRKLKKMKDNDNNTSKVLHFPWGTVKEETIKETNTIPPRSINHKIKTILAGGQIDIPKIEKKSKKSKKRKIQDPVNVLPKPRWIKSLEEKRKHKENSGSESEMYDCKIVKKIRLDDTASNATTEFFVKSLSEKNQQKTCVTGINSSAFEFKKKAISSDRIPRETSKQLLQRKAKQRINAIFK